MPSSVTYGDSAYMSVPAQHSVTCWEIIICENLGRLPRRPWHSLVPEALMVYESCGLGMKVFP